MTNPELTIYQFETDPDPFDISDARRQRKQYYTVHQYTRELLNKCRTDKPLWIVITFPFVTKDRNNQLKELYKAISENFNYEYTYNYFFNPEKIKGIPYKPANEESLNKRMKTYNGSR